MFFATLRLLLVSVIFSVAFGGQWALDEKSSTSVLVGVGAATDKLATAAAGANGIGAFVERWQDKSVWTKEVLQAGMILDAAVSPSGKTVSTSVWNVFLSTDNGGTYSTATGVSGASQSANTFGADRESFALVGNFAVKDPETSKSKSVCGVASSRDGGASWTISADVPPEWARYGAFPSDTTWYVSSGIWGSSEKLSVEKLTHGEHRLSERLVLGEKGFRMAPTVSNSTMIKSGAGVTGWFGAVSKSTDAGKTWTQVFRTNLETDIIYFNGISCGSESRCVVAGEGYDNDGNYLTQAYLTEDGGSTWNIVLKTGDVGMMQVKFISESEAWIAGTSKDGRNLYGQFYHSTDGGKTFTLAQSLANCYAIDMDFATTMGFAACSSSSGGSSTVAVYK